jgi:hypothetical protein
LDLMKYGTGFDDRVCAACLRGRNKMAVLHICKRRSAT